MVINLAERESKKIKNFTAIVKLQVLLSSLVRAMKHKRVEVEEKRLERKFYWTSSFGSVCESSFLVTLPVL